MHIYKYLYIHSIVFKKTLQFEQLCQIYIDLFFPHQKGDGQYDGQCLYVILTAAIVLSL